ncbi:MBL fold metallo-hydrolase [Paraflavitalea sp. CAU 1676]|uniref:MBL fold metallo-hydrolase n=1 Tax=Paraflavitalea sp. CAU 1676 TaxID=3032598 RepID=UPI0023DC7F6C|nr:MBL fold metallo-hydrolase [Paraflavitalea sp. CAU 1676]MDF2187211.1 MBL fold metallo-hydrolase [Paraflavitalea sp. CAU 1676]
MKIIPLSEGTFTIDKTKLFVPFDTSTDELQERPTGSLLVEVQPFVVITSEDVLLLDTGLGFTTPSGRLQLHENLSNHGINPSDVTKVLMTHLHKDHAGGVSHAAGGNTGLSFPRATYYVQRKEFEFAFEKGFPSYIPEELEPLRNSPQVTWLDGNGVIDGYIKYEVTAAHSPWHQVYWIVDGGERVFFGGDDAPQLQQMRSRFVAKYDYDGKKCMELRQQWWKQGEEEKWTFLFYHDVKNPVWNF